MGRVRRGGRAAAGRGRPVLASPPDAVVEAAWVLPLDAPPIRGGAVAVRAGRIAAVGPARDVAAAFPRLPRRRAGLLLPALVNAHAHLDLTGLAAARRLPHGSFTAWLEALIGTLERRSPSPRAAAAAVRRGLSLSRAAGVGLVLDHASRRAPSAARRGGPVDVVEVREAPFERRPTTPHAPYTCPAAVVRRLASAARQGRRPLSIHAAESEEEVELFATGGGALARLLAARGRPVPSVRRTTPVAWLESLGALGPRTILVHMSYATPADLDRTARRGASICLCPRTAARFGARADVAGIRRRRIRLLLGTDSTATAPDLDLRAEARAAVDRLGLSPAAALGAAGPDAADALGRRDRGRLAPGVRADLLAIETEARTAEAAAVAALSAPWHDPLR